MAVRPIVVWPDPRLREETRRVDAITDEVKALYRDLVDTMYAYNGVGIAAVQIGEPVKMFLIESHVAGGADDEPPWAFINPDIVWLSDDTEKVDEGCLSFPGIYVPIERAYRCRLRAMNIRGETFEVDGEALFARAMQHEFDHLSGKLMVDFVGPLKKQMIKRKLKKAQEEAATNPKTAASR